MSCVTSDMETCQWAFFCSSFSICCILLAMFLMFVVQHDYTALMLAAMYGHVEIVQLLLNAGATVNDKDKTVQNQCSFSFFVFFLSKLSILRR